MKLITRTTSEKGYRTLPELQERLKDLPEKVKDKLWRTGRADFTNRVGEAVIMDLVFGKEIK